MFHFPIISTWKARFTLRILEFLRVLCRNMIHVKLAIGHLSLFHPTVPGTSHKGMQSPPLPCPSSMPSPTPHKQILWGHPLSLGVCIPAASWPSEGQTPGKTQTLEISLGPLGQEILRCKVLTVCLGWKDSRSKQACPTDPTDSLP